MKDTYLRLIISLFCIVLINAKQDTIIFSSQDLVINNTIVHHEILGVYASDYSASIVNLNGVVQLITDSKCSEGYSGVENMILLSNGACPEEDIIWKAKDAGAAGVGFVDGVLVGRAYNYHIAGLEKDLMPIFYITHKDFNRLSLYSEKAVIELTLMELENEFAVFYKSPVLLVTKISFLLIFSIMIIYIFWKLVLAVKKYHLVSPVSASLTFELIACIARLFFWIDPIGSQGIYSHRLSLLLYFISFTPSFAAHLMLSLHWLDTLKALQAKVNLSTFSGAIISVFVVLSVVTCVLTVVVRRFSLMTYVFYSIMIFWLLIVIIFKVYSMIKLTNFRKQLEKQDIIIGKIHQTIIWYIGATFFCATFVCLTPIIFFFTSVYLVFLFYLFNMISLIGMSFSEIYPLNVLDDVKTKLTYHNSEDTSAAMSTIDFSDTTEYSKEYSKEYSEECRDESHT